MAMLNTKQLRFVDEYCISHSAADADRKAGDSVKTAYAIGAENLRSKRPYRPARRLRRLSWGGCAKQQVIADILEAIQTERVQGNPGAMIQGAR